MLCLGHGDTEIFWIRFRFNQAAGKGEWQYKEVQAPAWTEEVEADIRDMLEHEHFIDTGHDKYRGVEVQRILAPPEEEVQNALEEAEANLEEAQQDVERHQKLLRLLKEDKFYKEGGA